MQLGCRDRPRDYFGGSQFFLTEAIERGDTSHVKKLVATTELNKPGKEDMTLLFWALMNTLYDKKTQPRLQIVTELIRAGADPLQPSLMEKVARQNLFLWQTVGSG